MARKNCERINAVKIVTLLKHWYAVGQRFFFQRYGNFILTPTVGTFADCTYNIVILHLEGDLGKDRVRRFRLSTAFLQDVNICR